MKKLIIRIKMCIIILLNVRPHWALISLKTKELEMIFLDKEVDINIMYHGLQPYVIDKILINIADSKDRDELLLERIVFETEAETGRK